MLVVSDTSCLSNLYQIEHLHLLKNLFAEIYIPPAVYNELSFYHANDLLPEIAKFGIKVHTIEDKQLIEEILLSGVDLGEAEAITLSIELHSSFLLIDEKHGKEIAKQRNVEAIGILGLILLAKDKGFIEKTKPLYDALRVKTRFYFSNSLYHFFLNKAGELGS